MTRNITTAVAIVALASGLSVSSASAKHHHAKPQADAHAEMAPGIKGSDAATNRAAEIQGVNPMQNSPVAPPAPNKQPYVAVPGVNPM